jgi:hypothetical protein
MQQAVNHRIAIRACGRGALLALVACCSMAWAATNETADGRVVAARSLFTASQGVSGGAPVAPYAKSGPDRIEDRAKLDQQRGGTDTHNDMRLDGNVAGNSAVNVVTGANSIDAGSFANMSGIPVVIQNSGANVLIQNATIINLQFK